MNRHAKTIAYAGAAAGGFALAAAAFVFVSSFSFVGVAALLLSCCIAYTAKPLRRLFAVVLACSCVLLGLAFVALLSPPLAVLLAVPIVSATAAAMLPWGGRDEARQALSQVAGLLAVKVA